MEHNLAPMDSAFVRRIHFGREQTYVWDDVWPCPRPPLAALALHAGARFPARPAPEALQLGCAGPGRVRVAFDGGREIRDAAGSPDARP